MCGWLTVSHVIIVGRERTTLHSFQKTAGHVDHTQECCEYSHARLCVSKTL